MAASPFDSAIYRHLFGHDEVARLFTDTAEIRAMMLVEGTLARVQGEMGMIPAESAAAIHRASLELQIDPGAIAEATGANGVPVPALVARFREEMQAPEHAQYLHWGATSQDIVDTALMLRMKRALGLIEAELISCLQKLAGISETHSETAMSGRTYGQAAAPTTFGALAASWGSPLLRLADRLGPMTDRSLCVSLSGAAGTGAVWGKDAPELRAKLAQALGLADPGESWHANRDRVAEMADWLAQLCVSNGKMGRDISLLAQSGIAELRLATAGASSTMPQKKNPVGPATLEALAQAATAFEAGIRGAGVHGLQRDGAAWFTEWLLLPQLVLAAARSAALARSLAGSLEPDSERMAETLSGGLGLIHAEAITFALARHMPRPEAARQVKALCREAEETGKPLPELAEKAFSGHDLSNAIDRLTMLGEAPELARRFARAVRKAHP